MILNKIVLLAWTVREHVFVLQFSYSWQRKKNKKKKEKRKYYSVI